MFRSVIISAHIICFSSLQKLRIVLTVIARREPSKRVKPVVAQSNDLQKMDGRSGEDQMPCSCLHIHELSCLFRQLWSTWQQGQQKKTETYQGQKEPRKKLWSWFKCLIDAFTKCKVCVRTKYKSTTENGWRCVLYNYNCYAIFTPPNACNCMCMCVRVIIRYCEC